MITTLFNKNILKVLSFFVLSPGSKFNRYEIKENTKLNNLPLDNTLLILINSKILKRNKNLYYLNFENQYTKQIILLLDKEYKYLKEIPFKVYLALIDLTNEIINTKDVEVYLFGSYSKLIYKENSDIDVAIIDTNIKSGIIEKLEKKYNIQLEIHYFNKNEFYKNKKDPIIKDIIKNGVKLI